MKFLCPVREKHFTNRGGLQETRLLFGARFSWFLRSMGADSKPPRSGRRAQLRTRLLKRGAGAPHDYEILEVILMDFIPRRDVKPIAKALEPKFAGLSAIPRCTAGRSRQHGRRGQNRCGLYQGHRGAAHARRARGNLHKGRSSMKTAPVARPPPDQFADRLFARPACAGHRAFRQGVQHAACARSGRYLHPACRLPARSAAIA